MEKVSAEQPKTKEEIRTRLSEIDRQLFGLSENLSRVPAEFEESGSGDDNATEAQPAEQRFGQIRDEREQLQAEAAELRRQLTELEQAA